MLLKRNDADQTGSPYVRLELATGHKHYGARGWVKREATGEDDNVSVDVLIQRYGATLRLECQQAGFEPQFAARRCADSRRRRRRRPARGSRVRWRKGPEHGECRRPATSRVARTNRPSPMSGPRCDGWPTFSSRYCTSASRRRRDGRDAPASALAALADA